MTRWWKPPTKWAFLCRTRIYRSGSSQGNEAKYASIDHVDGYLEGLVPSTVRVNPNTNGFFGITFTDIADQELIPGLVKATKKAGVLDSSYPGNDGKMDWPHTGQGSKR